ncbi:MULTISPECIES: hypothetical protein [Bacillus cereus group]|uniref:hypothetical protein n=2 Tax=Bacillus cereus group TaxID=86661 RepID=UPI00097699E9|nr:MULTISPECIES: hypothetical protein [unclassified Bacillus cereus group]MDA2195485.1 hypothetical protein [Bacillus cereus group sp. Bc238]MDA2763090.1 hypothetical protein [Bacillus cereus group sp. Bc008]ONG66145.1 hypothetical protein BKK44_22360 [Bacillus cereus]HDR7286946.1 hypothetical protein [Bacillus paranthracis]
MSTSSMSNASTSTTSQETLHQVKATDGASFILSDGEVLSILNRMQFPYVKPSIESLLTHKNLILVPRYRMTKNLKKYHPLQVLRETDSYVFMCEKELFRETVAHEIKEAHTRHFLDELDEEILQGRLTDKRRNTYLLKQR